MRRKWRRMATRPPERAPSGSWWGGVFSWAPAAGSVADAALNPRHRWPPRLDGESTRALQDDTAAIRLRHRPGAPGGRAGLLRPHLLREGVRRAWPADALPAVQRLSQRPIGHAPRDALQHGGAPRVEARALRVGSDLRRHHRHEGRIADPVRVLRRGAVRGERQRAVRPGGLRARLRDAHGRRRRLLSHGRVLPRRGRPGPALERSLLRHPLAARPRRHLGERRHLPGFQSR